MPTPSAKAALTSNTGHRRSRTVATLPPATPTRASGQPVLLLLAVLVGRPDDIGPLFTALRSGPPDRGLIPFLRHPTSPGHIDNAGSDGTGTAGSSPTEAGSGNPAST